jgi:5'-3' exonuclease
MDVHLVDGTYELFRHFFAMPSQQDDGGNEVGAVRGVIASIQGLIEAGATHVGVATDHVIESFRNELYPGYKTGEGVPEPLMAQFPVLEEELRKMGVTVWAMVEFEADDALASAAAKAAGDDRVRQIFICTPDKDLAQCVVGKRVVQFDRMRRIVRDEDGVVEKFGVRPESIPDYLAVVGDSADGFPGLPGWGPKSAATLLARYGHLEHIPRDWRQWPNSLRGAQKLATVLTEQMADALLFRTLATLRRDVPVFESVDELDVRGVRRASA